MLENKDFKSKGVVLTKEFWDGLNHAERAAIISGATCYLTDVPSFILSEIGCPDIYSKLEAHNKEMADTPNDEVD